MDTASAIKTLNLFNEKADKLESLSFTRKIFGEESGVSVSWKRGQEVKTERRGPDEEAIDAFVLTLRFFVQDNEKSSLRKMAELYDGLQIDSDLIEDFHKARDALNQYLDSCSFIKINEHQLTQREVFEVIMWGGLAHANEKKKAVYDEWSKIPIVFPMLQNEFVVTLANTLKVLFYIRDLNQKVIQELESK